jgi:hypothetical protein
MTRYQRRPDRINAVRLTAQGAIPVDAAGLVWIRRLVADKRIQAVGDQSLWIKCSESYSIVAYPGQWIVEHDNDTLGVVNDEAFREHYVALSAAEMEAESEEA